MTSHRLLAHLVALGIILGACSHPDDADTGAKRGSGGASATGGTTVTSGGATGSGTGGDTGTGGSTGGDTATGGATGSGGAVGLGGSGTGGRGGTGMASGGASGPSGGSSGTGSSCPAGTGLCEDFESYPEGTSPGAAATGRWMSVRMGKGTAIAVDSMQAYSGSKALHITGTNLAGGISATASTVVISTKPGDPAFAGSPTTGYVRFMMFMKTYMQSGSTHGRMVRIGNDTIDSLSNPMGYGFVLAYDKPASFKLEQFADNLFGDVDPLMSLGKWHCWEFQIGTEKTVHWWMDSTELPGKVPSSWDTQTVKFSKMTIGFETYTPLPAIEFWYDDVAFDATKRIGCPAAKP